jgi:virginiamycin B lyase
MIASVMLCAIAAAGCNANVWSGEHTAPLAPGGSTYAGVVPHVAQSSPPGLFVEFQIPTANSQPEGITLGSDANIWFTEYAGNKIGTVTNSGAITEFAIPTAASGSSYIAPGAGNDLWFAETSADAIGRINTSGVITEYHIPTPSSGPFSVTLGPDGNTWFTEAAANKIGRVDSNGAFAEFALPKLGSAPGGITAGPDGAMWFAETGAARIGRITLTGHPLKEYAIPAPAEYITTASDGDIYFSIPNDHAIGKMTTAGVFLIEFKVPIRPSEPWGVVGGPARIDIWYMDRMLNSVMSFNTSDHSLAIFTVPTTAADPQQIAWDPDNNLWFTETAGNKVGVYVRLRQTDTPSSLHFTAVGQVKSFSAQERKYVGTFTAGGCNAAVATISGSPGTTFHVTARGAGTCNITVSDPYDNTSNVPVTVTAGASTR